MITGVTGQDGAYLAESLLGKGYILYGIKRRTSLFNTDRIDNLYQNPHISNRLTVLRGRLFSRAAIPRSKYGGTGTPRREVLYSEDMAEGCVLVMSLSNKRLKALFPSDRPPLINIGCGEDLTIREFTEAVARVVGFRGRLRFDTSKPDGTPRKVVDVSRFRELGWKPRVDLDEGVRLAYQDFQARRKSAATS